MGRKIGVKTLLEGSNKQLTGIEHKFMFAELAVAATTEKHKCCLFIMHRV